MNRTARFAPTLALAMFLISINPMDAEARGFRRSGPNGTVGARGGSFVGPNGGRWQAGAGGIGNRNAGLVGGGFRGTGPNGGSGQGAGVAGWRRGTGGFERTGMSLQGAGGSTYNGFTKGAYNAKTGQGAYDASHQVYDAKNGKSYGDANQTTYSNGQGVTQLNTDNHGDYTIDWGKGQQPTMTKDAPVSSN